MTTTSKLFTGDEYPKDDVDEDCDSAEHEPEHEEHAPDPALHAREPRHAAAHAGDPAVRDRAAQPVDREPGSRCPGALREQLVQLLELVGLRHQISRISRAGSSRASLILTKNKTASRPSMMRWSYESAR